MHLMHGFNLPEPSQMHLHTLSGLGQEFFFGISGDIAFLHERFEHKLELFPQLTMQHPSVRDRAKGLLGSIVPSHPLCSKTFKRHPKTQEEKMLIE